MSPRAPPLSLLEARWSSPSLFCAITACPAPPSRHGRRPSPTRSPRAPHHLHHTHHLPALTYTLTVAMVEDHMAGFTTQRCRVAFGEPPQAPVADDNPTIDRGMTPRAPCTHHLSPPRANTAGVTNSSEPGLPLPCSGITAVTPSIIISLSPSLCL